jgi:1-acyl-sn-glycerol-3-phosphate acyltransferase
MVDIEPGFEYNCSKIGVKNILSILYFIYASFIHPICAITNYDIKTEKKLIRSLVMECMKILDVSFHRVSKKGLIVDKDIMYMTNHVSVGDFFIDPYVLHYTSRFIALHKAAIMLPVLGIISYNTCSNIFINQGNTKEIILENFKKIEEIRKKDDKRNISLYPEGMRRPHRHTVSTTLKKGFIYHSFENNLPIQIIHTTNKDYVVDDENLLVNKKMKLFTYYGPKIDPQKLRTKFEKKHKRSYTKEDYYNDVYKSWSKIWSKMDKYRIDTLHSQGLSHEECLAKMEHYATTFPRIEDKIEKGDTPLTASFLLLRAILWSIVYFIIFKIVEKSFSVISSIYKCGGSTANATSGNTCSLGCSFFKNFPFSLAPLTSHVVS